MRTNAHARAGVLGLRELRRDVLVRVAGAHRQLARDADAPRISDAGEGGRETLRVLVCGLRDGRARGPPVVLGEVGEGDALEVVGAVLLVPSHKASAELLVAGLLDQCNVGHGCSVGMSWE